MNSLYSYTKSNTLSEKQKTDIFALFNNCKSEDGENALLFADEGENIYPKLNCFYFAYKDDLLVGYIGVFAPDGYVLEIYPLTHPKYRRQGIFKSLFNMVSEEFVYFKYETYSFPIKPNYEVGKSILKRMGAYEYSTEHLMSYEINNTFNPQTSMYLDSYNSKEGRVYLLCEKVLKKFTRHIGSLLINTESDTASLSGLEIARSKRGRGYSRIMLELLCNDLSKKGIKKILLHVSSNNTIACNLYSSFGFTTVESLTYMYIDKSTE